MIGVTLSSPGFEELAQEAALRFQRCTGLPYVIVGTPEARNYKAKLELPSMFNQTVVWFDADLWFIQKCDLSGFDDQEEFIAVNDPGIHDPTHFPFHDCKTLDLDVTQYFNTGFFIWNNRHVEAFNEARRVLHKLGNVHDAPHMLKDFGEQSSLNAGVQRKTKLRLISNSFNYMPFAEIQKLRGMSALPNPLTIHGAGYGPEIKMEAMRFFAAKYSGHFGCEGSTNHTSA